MSRFGGGSRSVVDFLVDEVLEAHDPETQTLMLRSSILERLSGSLCDAVVEQEGSDERLASLSRTNLFLLPLDDQGEWYRFHHLFAQLLRVELEHREPGLAPALHRRACAWYRDHGSVSEAIEHAVEAGAFDEAGDLIASSWVDYMNVNREATVLAWLERFPRERLGQDSRLLLVSAWIFTLVRATRGSGGGNGCDRTAWAARRGAAARRLQLGRIRSGHAARFVMWGDVGAGMHHSRRAAELEGQESRWRPVICVSLGLQTYHTGDLDQSDAWFRESVELARSRGLWSIASFASSFRSLVAGDDGRFDDQQLLAEEAVHLEREHGVQEIEGSSSLAQGAALAAQQRFEEALPMLERSLGMLRSKGHPLRSRSGSAISSPCSRPWLGPRTRPTRSVRRGRFSTPARIRGFGRNVWLHSSIRRRPDAEAATGR